MFVPMTPQETSRTAAGGFVSLVVLPASLIAYAVIYFWYFYQSGQNVVAHDTVITPSARQARRRITGWHGLNGVPGRIGRPVCPSGGGTGRLARWSCKRAIAAKR